MSIQHVAAVLDARDERLAGSRKLVLITLANRTNEHGKCWPSQGLLSGECGISVRAISDHLKALEQDGFIQRNTQHLGKGNGSRTTYTLHLDALKVAPADTAGAEVAHANLVGCTGSSLRVTNLQEPTIEKGKPFSSSTSEVDVAFEAYQKVANRLKESNGGKVLWPTVASFNRTRRAALTARIKEHGLQAWGTVLRKASASPHCLGDNSRQWVASFDFLTSPSGFIKTLEGNYDQRDTKTTAGNRAGSPKTGDRLAAFDRLAEDLAGYTTGQDAGVQPDAFADSDDTIDAERTSNGGYAVAGH
jgi:DNA-binding HxlR family transcriptional regulator